MKLPSSLIGLLSLGLTSSLALSGCDGASEDDESQETSPTRQDRGQALKGRDKPNATSKDDDKAAPKFDPSASADAGAVEETAPYDDAESCPACGMG